MRKLALVFALLGGLAACSKNTAAPATPANTAPDPVPAEASGGEATEAAPGGPADMEKDADDGGEPLRSDPCSGGE